MRRPPTEAAQIQLWDSTAVSNGMWRARMVDGHSDHVTEGVREAVERNNYLASEPVGIPIEL
jgi:hypothetical protein